MEAANAEQNPETTQALLPVIINTVRVVRVSGFLFQALGFRLEVQLSRNTNERKSRPRSSSSNRSTKNPKPCKFRVRVPGFGSRGLGGLG